MTFIAIFRYIALGTALFFGLIALGLTAHWTKGSLAGNVFFDFEIVGIIAGGLSALALPVLLVVGLIRRKAFTSMFMVELPVLTVLWILWLATAAVVAQWGNVFYPFGCGDFLPGSDGWCRELFAIEGMSFIIWITLFLYTLTLLIFSLIGQSRGNPVWTVSANEAIFFDRPGTDQTFVPTYSSTGAPINSGSYTMPPLVQQFQQPPAGTTPIAQANPAALNQYNVAAAPVVGVAPIHADDSHV